MRKSVKSILICPVSVIFRYFLHRCFSRFFICIVCIAPISAEVLCAKFHGSFIRVIARDTYCFSYLRQLLKSQDEESESTAFDENAKDLDHFVNGNLAMSNQRDHPWRSNLHDNLMTVMTF